MDSELKNNTIIPPIIGIDLGTTMSAVSIVQEGGVKIFKNPLGEYLTPSVVAYSKEDDQIITGRLAKDATVLSPLSGVSLFKREMGLEVKKKFGPKSASPIELSSYIINSLRRDAENELKIAIDSCVVTVPAYFNEPERQATKAACELAGLQVKRILNEPTAAAISFGMHNIEKECTFAVIDLGGGTFDVCIMEIFNGILEVKSVAGDSQLGGEDFTDTLAALVLSKAGLQKESLTESDIVQLRRKAELAKRTLSLWSSTQLNLSFSNIGELTVSIKLEEANDCWQELIKRMFAPCLSAIRGSGVSKEELSAVLMVGGATRMPCVVEFVTKVFGISPSQDPEPDLIVVKGAAIQAGLISKDKFVQDYVITDIASHSLGINACREIGGEDKSGYFWPIIHRNTVIPTSRACIFHTIVRNQRSINIEVYEGEGRKVAENTKIGEFKVSGIPSGEPREAISVRFTFDLSGLLEVEVTVLETKKVYLEVFNHLGIEFSDKQKAAYMDNIANLKKDPLTLPRYKDLLNRASLLWSDLREGDREKIDIAIEIFESAMDTRTPKYIERAYKELSEICKLYDSGERW